MTLRIFILLFIVVNIPQVVSAQIVGFNFAGTVTQRFSSPWGEPIQVSNPVAGRFLYDIGSQTTHPFTDECEGTCAGYRQQIHNGFSAMIGATELRADDYVVGVFNDSPTDEGTEDIFFVRFHSALDPPPTSPLLVDGSPQAIGLFNISFSGDSSLFPDSSLPHTLNLNDFSFQLGAVSDTAFGLPDLLFSIETLDAIQRVPGDYDFDTDIDEHDYSRWRSTFGSRVDMTADGNLDGLIDAADYVMWRKLQPNMQTLYSPVPEPSGALQAIFAAIACLLSVMRSRFIFA